MADIKAKARIRQFSKNRAQLRLGASNEFSIIHILDTHQPAEISPWGEVLNRIRMKNQRKLAVFDRPEALNHEGFLGGIHRAGKMDRYVVEPGQVQVVQSLN